MKKTLQEYRFVIFILIIIYILYLFFSAKSETTVSTQNTSTTTKDYSLELSSIEAKSYYVYDINEDKVIFEKSEHDRLPLASITKLMSGFIILDILPGDSTVTIDRSDTALGSGTGLIVGEKWKLKDLLDFSLINSSNDGIHALSRTFDAVYATQTVDLMNQRARDLGLKDTFFINTTGLDVDQYISGAYSSASDVAKLFKSILENNPALIESTNNQYKTFISESNFSHVAKNTNVSINNIPSLIASKTGFTDLAGGNLAIIFDAGFNHPIVVVVLGSSEEGRFKDVEVLVKTALEKITDF